MQSAPVSALGTTLWLLLAMLLFNTCRVEALPSNQTAAPSQSRAKPSSKADQTGPDQTGPAIKKPAIVSPPQDWDDSEQNPLKISITSDRKTAYIHEQILITIEVSAPDDAFAITSKGLRLRPDQTQANLTALKREVYKASSGRQSIRTRYALFIDKAGSFTLPRVTATATLPVASSVAGSKKRNPRLRARSAELQVAILDAAPSPTTDRETGDPLWFTASDVSIEQRWIQTPNASGENSGSSETAVDKSTEAHLPAVDSKNTHSITVEPGNPVVREVSISVTGQHATRIPLYDLPALAPLRQYPNPVINTNTLAANSLSGVRVMSTTLIAPTLGEFVLPPLIVQWWDINTKRWRRSELPQQILVAGDVQQSKNPASQDPEQTGNGQTTPGSENANLDQYSGDQGLKKTFALPPLTRPQLAFVLLGLLVLGISVGVVRRELRLRREPLTEKQAFANLQRSVRKMKPQRKAQDHRTTYQHLHACRLTLLQWASFYYVDKKHRDNIDNRNGHGRKIQGLQQLQTLCPDLHEPLQTLERLLYSPAPLAANQSDQSSYSAQSFYNSSKDAVHTVLDTVSKVRSEAEPASLRIGHELEPLYPNLLKR